MKKILLLSVIAALFPALGSAQGIVFEQGTFADAIRKAKAENKLIFVDFFTDWCGPCKQMTADVFTQDAVGDVFNRNFVNVKIDAEKGEGIELSRKAGVQGYPTMMFLNPDNGATVHMILGYRNEDELLDEVRQLEDSGKYGGLEQMRADFDGGRADLEFLVDYLKLLPAESPERTLVAERWLVNVPAADFKSEDVGSITFIGGTGGIFDALSEWNDEAMRRVLGLLAEKQQASGNTFFSTDYNIGVVFPLELAACRFIERAIKSGDERLLERLLAYQHDYDTALGRPKDGDPFIMSGRGIFFASPDMIRLEYMSRNGNDPERFRREAPAYMQRLMAAMPPDSIRSERAGNGYYPWEAGMKRTSQLVGSMIGSAAWASDMSIEFIVGWANYYWRLMPNDRKTKNTVAAWLDYACSLNPYSAKGAMSAAPLLVKVGHASSATANLETVLRSYGQFDLDLPQFTRGVRDMITDIANDKI